MNWKNLSKYGLILWGFSLILGFILALVNLNDSIFFSYNEELIWFNAILISIIIPFLYPLFISKKSWKEAIAIAFVYVLVSIIIFIPLNLLTDNLISFGHRQREEIWGKPIMNTGEVISDTFASNPTSSLTTAICYKYLVSWMGDKKVPRCFLLTGNLTLDGTFIIIPTGFAFVVVSIPILSGNFLANLRGKK